MSKEPKELSQDDKMTMKEWESEMGLMFHDFSPKKVITREEMWNLQLSGQTTSVDMEARTKFLEDNGYDLTRENYMDITLNTRQRQQLEE